MALNGMEGKRRELELGELERKWHKHKQDDKGRKKEDRKGTGRTADKQKLLTAQNYQCLRTR